MPPIKTLALAALLTAAGGAAQATSYVFTTITAPGVPAGDSSAGVSINDKGQVLVQAAEPNVAFDFTVVDDVYNSNTHVYTAFPAFPGSAANSTAANGINNSGEVVGNYHPSGGGWQGFSYAGGVFTPVNAFGGDYNIAYGISNNGQVVGTAGSFTTLATQGYLYSGGVYTAIDAAPFPANLTIAEGVNDSGAIVGFTLPTGSNSILDTNSFLDVGGVFSPIAMPGEATTYVGGINDAMVMVGAVSNDGFFTGPAFVDDHGVFSTLMVPGATETFAFDINNRGQIVGDYIDANGAEQAFLATPVPEPASWAMLLIGFAGLGAAIRARRAAVSPFATS